MTEKELRKVLAQKARSKQTRINEFSRNLPCDWGPEKIINPKSGFFFSDDIAWNLIADLLESNHELEVIKLKKPPGQEAVVMLYDFDSKQSFIYIKIHMTVRNKVIGRSFHLSIKGREK